jgi:hypothetical protein
MAAKDRLADVMIDTARCYSMKLSYVRQ